MCACSLANKSNIKSILYLLFCTLTLISCLKTFFNMWEGAVCTGCSLNKVRKDAGNSGKAHRFE